MSAPVLFSKLKDAVESDDLVEARKSAERIISECENDGPAAVALRGDGLFDALCVEMSIGAMENTSANTMTKFRRLFGTCVLDDFQQALHKYVEGTARLRTSAQLARQRFSEALSADPHFVLAHLGLAVVAYAEGAWKLCFSELKHVISALGDLTPNIVRVLLGVCALRLREFDHARQCLTRALECDSDDPMALLANFAIHAHFREAPQAAKLIERLEQVAPTTNIQQKRTDILFYRHLARGSLDAEAPALLARIEHTLTAATTLGNTRLQAYAEFQAGRLLHAQGLFVPARDRYANALQLDATLRAAQVHIAELERALSGRATCDTAVAAGLALNEKDPRLLEMATLLSSEGLEHSRAIGFAKLLVESVAKARPETWTMAAWANRLDSVEFVRLNAVASQLRRHYGMQADGAMDANVASLSRDLNGLMKAAQLSLGVDLNVDTRLVKAIGPRELPFWYNYALLNEATNQQRARSIYVMLVKLAPSESVSYVRLVMLAQRAGRPCEALRWAKLFRASKADESTAAVMTAWVLKNQGMLSESLSVVRAAASRTPDEALAICTGALYLADSVDSTRGDRKVSMALNGFAYALDKDNHNVLAAHGAACCLANQGKQLYVAGLLERVSEIDCNVPEMKTGIVDHRFNVLVETRAYRNAIATLAGKANPTRAQRCSLAMCYSATGDHSKAIDVLDKALTEQPKDATVCFYLTFTLLQAVFDVVTRRAPVTRADGEQARNRLERGIDVSKYAVGVRSDDQRSAVKQIVAFVKKGGIERAIDRRVADYERERADAAATDAAWRDAASQLESRKSEAIRYQQSQDEERARLRRESSLVTYVHQQNMMFSWTNGVAATTGVAAAVAADGEAEQDAASHESGSKRGRSAHGLEDTFAELAANVDAAGTEQAHPEQPRAPAETLAVGTLGDE